MRERYRPLGDSRQLDRVFAIANSAGSDAVFIDSPYIDLDYRSDHSHFYGRAFKPPPDVTERLVFTRGDEITGISVIRPIPQQVGRTVMVPPLELASYISCTATASVNVFGQEWPVSGFPFSSQDGEYGVCAHAAIWAMARYHHLRFSTDRYTVSGIIDAAGMRERADRTARSNGLYVFDIVRAFRGLGLPALTYDVGEIPPPENLDKVICRYLNSAIPVGIVTENHMIVACGYGERPDGTIFYFVSDDNHSAYERVDQVPQGTASGAWKMLVIPLPGRMHVSGEAAEARAEQAFEDRIRATAGPGHLLAKWEQDELRVRTYATPSPTYTNGLAERSLPQGIVQHHLYAPKSGWLWITEFQDLTRPEAERVVGEIAVDATSLRLDPTPLFGNIDGWAYRWEPGDEEPEVTQAVQAGSAHSSAIGDRTEIVPPPPPPPFMRQGPAPVTD
ncbi:hypothetical protein LRS13_02955 [Svornostia abyssi]|uniref:Peptidase C39-like domain-containing protein n=1 Tax=Svornostia abyssi TaxID=2898438 RepID=A0ABY5PIR7_9ACTN|nr:hypothetical protein LRS13_02955 [Parviterribacteraceae bacterium J379]